jgi:hypothetical protein
MQLRQVPIRQVHSGAPWAGRLPYAEIGNCFVDLRHTREKAASQAVTAFLKRFRQLGRLQRR